MMKFQEKVLLKDYTTFKIGGPAKYFFSAKNKEELVWALGQAEKLKVPVFVLGGGSNVLVSDEGYNGLVVQIRNSKFEIRNSAGEVYAEAGVRMADLVKFCAENGLAGMEWPAGIPNVTLGGAIYGNAQAFGQKMADSVKEVEALDTRTLEFIKLSKEQCQFELKNSIFKKNKNLIIVSAVLGLKKGDKKEIEEKIREHLAHRNERHPKLPSAGSVFINPEKDGQVIHIGSLIEQCGLKGKKIGGAQFSEQHANFIVNLGKAKASDVLELINLAKREVKKNFGISLETEVQLLGFSDTIK